MNENQPLAFDGKDKPDINIVNDCVHCGFCLSACPTYIETGNELDSPRGRIYLIKSAIEGRINMVGSMVNHLDKCLGCLACETACPSGVKYRYLIENARSQINRRYKRSRKEKIMRELIFRLFPYSGRLRLLTPLIYLYIKSGLRNLVESGALKRVIPSALSNMSRMLPGVDNPRHGRLPEVVPPAGRKRFRVAMLSGCVQEAWFSHVNRATVNVLSRNGCEVFIPRQQGCCGALSVHSGRLGEGRKFAKKIIDEFISLDVDAIIVNSAGCGSSIKDYTKLLEDDPVYYRKAGQISKKTRDVFEFLDEVGMECELRELKIDLTYQDACHIVHGQGIKNAPREILKKIPGLNFIELPRSDDCCGSAGIYNLVQPGMAEDILNRKMENVKATGAGYVAASNPGCLMQLQKGIRMSELGMKTVHPVEILDMASTDVKNSF